MKQYHALLNKILDEGTDRGDRTGTGTRSLFAEKMEFNLTEGFPVVTTKSVYLKAVIHELLWFLAGDTNTRYLTEHDIHIWDGWADCQGDLGPVYGKQWRDWGGVDQMANLVESIRANPEDRRMIVNSWNVGELDEMALPPCHMFFQVYSRAMDTTELRATYLPIMPDLVDMPKDVLLEYLNACEVPVRYLSLQMYQRSADMFLGIPFNIAGYAILLEMLAAQTNHVAHMYTHVIGDAHIYDNHRDQVHQLLSRHPRSLPQLVLNPDVQSIFDYTFNDIQVIGYDPHPTIKAPLAI